MGAESLEKRDEATEKLRAMGPGISELLKKYGLKSPDLEIAMRARKLLEDFDKSGIAHDATVRAVIIALGNRKASQAVEPIARYLASESPAMRRAAAAALGSIGNDAARSKLVDAALKAPSDHAIQVIAGLSSCAQQADADRLLALCDGKSRESDLAVMELLARHGGTDVLAEAVCRYVASHGETPPVFIVDFLAKAYDKDDPDFDWSAFCKKKDRGTAKIESSIEPKVRARLLEGLADERTLALYDGCLRLIPKDAGCVAGVDIRQMRALPILNAYEEILHGDKTVQIAMSKLLAAGGAFHTEVAAGFMHDNVANDDFGFCFIFRGEYDSAEQAEFFGQYAGLKPATQNGIEYFTTRYRDLEVCCYDDRYVIISAQKQHPSLLPKVLDLIAGRGDDIRKHEKVMGLLDRNALTSAAWAAGRTEEVFSAQTGPRVHKDFCKLFAIEYAVATLRIDGDKLLGEVRGRTANALAASAAVNVIKAFIKEGEKSLEDEIAKYEKKWPSEAIDTERSALKFLQTAKISAKGENLTATVEFDTEAVGRCIHRYIHHAVIRGLVKYMRGLPRSCEIRYRIEKQKMYRDEVARRLDRPKDDPGAQDETLRVIANIEKEIAEMEKELERVEAEEKAVKDKAKSVPEGE